MLHLKAGVHLEERDQTVLADEIFDGAGTVIVGFLADALRGLVDLLALSIGEERRGSLLDQLLKRRCGEQSRVPYHDVAVLIRDHLRFDVAGLVEVALDEAFTATEGGDRLTRRRLNSSGISSSVRATFIPRPPPPNAALMAIGTPYSRAKATTSSASFTGSGVPGTSGAFARTAMWRAVTLSPRSRMDCGLGPIQINPRQGLPARNRRSQKGIRSPGESRRHRTSPRRPESWRSRDTTRRRFDHQRERLVGQPHVRSVGIRLGVHRRSPVPRLSLRDPRTAISPRLATRTFPKCSGRRDLALCL